MGEFERIARYLAPLAGDGAHGLKDDAAEAFGRVLTKDLLVEGVHFLSTDPLDLVARKALRVNESDLIAKGASPERYMLGLGWPERLGDEDFAAFCRGLEAEQRDTGLALLGGDTTSAPVLTISVTMMGVPLGGSAVRRSGGRPGDLLLVSGAIGDGLLGLEAARRAPPRDDAQALPYRLPAIASGAEHLVAEHASASLDVSDGLVADAGHLARASGVTLRIAANDVPLSPEGRAAALGGRLAELLTGGDDYQVLCLVPPEKVPACAPVFTVIGEALPQGEEGPGVDVRQADGSRMILPEAAGWDHFRRPGRA